MVKAYKQINKGIMEWNPFVRLINPATLSYKDKSMALDTVNLIKEKRNRKSKENKCADGSKPKTYLK